MVFDAEEAATRVMRASRPHLDSIAEMVAALESARTASAAGPRSHLTIVGEISAVLCRRGTPEAALELERLWDELTCSLPILTICTYPTGWFDHAEHQGWFQASQLITRSSAIQSGLDDHGRYRRS